MQPESAIGPELDLLGRDPEPAPERGPGRMGAVAQPLPGGFCHQRRAAFQRLRLARCPGADPALQGAAVVISIGLFAFDAPDATAHVLP